MNEKVTISIEEITPEIAQQYLKNNYKNNRTLKQVSVSQFANDMSEGNFILNPSAPIIFSKNGELIDGHHRQNTSSSEGNKEECDYTACMGSWSNADNL